MKRRTFLLQAVAVCSLFAAATPSHWVVTWGAAPSPQLSDDAQMRAAKLVFADQTLRQIVHTSIGGDSVRVRLSNAFGKDAVEIGAAHIALRAKGSAIVAASSRPLTFSGRPGIRIPPNAIVISDPVKLAVPASGDLAISLYLPKSTAGAGIHYSAQQINYIASGNSAGSATLAESGTIASWVFLAGVDVLAPQSAGAVVAFGDSITDGARSTVDANRRWPDTLARRLNARQGGARIAVLDAGIGGNRVLHDASANLRFGVNALARFDRDVLAQPGVKYVVVMEGINDLGHPGSSAPDSESVSAEDVIAGLRQLVERAHEHGLKIFGATLTPFEGTIFKGYFTPEKEARRKAINAWIRTGKAFDGVIDFDKVLRDPQKPDTVRADYDAGDHLHPGDAGYQAMGEAVDLSLFK